MDNRLDRRPVAVLVLSNLLGGVGVASGIAVGALLVEQVGGTSVAGLGQAVSTLGAAVAAIPLASVATRFGRRWSLTTGYALSVLGAVLILLAAMADQLVVLMLGLACFGVAQAANLQSRYAATDGVPMASRGRAMSIVVWATTIGSVAGPNLTALGRDVGLVAGLPGLAGPYLFSLVAFAAAGLVVALLYRPARTMADDDAAMSDGAATADDGTAADRVGPARSPRAVGALAALRWAAQRRLPRFAVVLLAGAHAVMVTIMVMTPLHMQHNGMSLQVVGVVISLHIVGMYALSPVFGWSADRFGAVPTAVFGVATLTVAVVLGFTSALLGGSVTTTAAALGVLGVGWSASTISASALIAGTAADDVRLPLQGATDAGMNYAGALAAAAAGPILAVGGFQLINAVAGMVLLPVVVLLVGLRRRPAEPGREEPDVPAPGAPVGGRPGR